MSKIQHIVGIDEVGMGSWAGPLVIGAVRAPIDWSMEGLKDSKKLSKNERERLSSEILRLANNGVIQVVLEIANNDEIDKLGLGVCHKKSYARAIKKLYNPGDEVILDGNLKPELFIKHGLDIDLKNVRSEIKADDKFQVVSAASVVTLGIKMLDISLPIIVRL
jgi:ribonuclease HII